MRPPRLHPNIGLIVMGITCIAIWFLCVMGVAYIIHLTKN